ncbi:MAG: hypothetical protein KF715_09810 [Candidatus Didemnitutus sp.]|nr:hypothetical protein [Candidatus Didemnitutus sp.]
MKRWLGDWFRTVGAWWWWNARKTVFVARGRKGHCPCHNPSDSGSGGDVRCDAVIFWAKPERFQRRVCPLLTKSAKGEWVCSVPPAQVRPYWGRVFASHATAGIAVVLIAGGLTWGGMRLVGYRVTLRQVFWPRAWSELKQVRSDLFRDKAEAALVAGQPREAIANLLVARQLNPGDYASGMMLAQLLQLIQPETVDGFYRQMFRQHPEHANEIARIWCRSMLARGQMAGVAALAQLQLVMEPGASAAWAHALLTAARWERNWDLLTKVANDPKMPAMAREVCALEAQIRRGDAAAARAALAAAGRPGSPYATMQRVERLIEFGDTFEALDLLRLSRASLSGRDVARLTLAAHAVGRNPASLQREVSALIGARGDDGAAGVAIVGQHLIRYPNAALLEQVRAACLRLPATAARDEAAAAVFCAAALAGQADALPELRKLFSGESSTSLVAQQKIEERLRGKGWSPLFLLSVVRTVSADLNYAVLERMMADRPAVPPPAVKKK